MPFLDELSLNSLLPNSKLSEKPLKKKSGVTEETGYRENTVVTYLHEKYKRRYLSREILHERVKSLSSKHLSEAKSKALAAVRDVLLVLVCQNHAYPPS